MPHATCLLALLYRKNIYQSFKRLLKATGNLEKRIDAVENDQTRVYRDLERMIISAKNNSPAVVEARRQAILSLVKRDV